MTKCGFFHILPGIADQTAIASKSCQPLHLLDPDRDPPDDIGMAIKIKESVITKVDILSLSICKVLDETAQEVSLYSLWQKQTAIFIFLRHFGCLMCRAHAKQVWGLREQYEKTGAKIYFIGNGSPYLISKFKEDLGLEAATIFTDPQLLSFKASGFRRGFLAALGPKALGNGRKLFKEGHRQGENNSENGDLWQLGGILVVKTDGKVGYHYISQVAGDYSPAKDVEEIQAIPPAPTKPVT